MARARLVGWNRWHSALAIGLALVAVAAIVAVAYTGDPSRSAATERPVGAPSSVASRTNGPPNIVFVLTDDLAWNLVPYMPHVQALAQDGMSFTNYTVTDSLCCPSRASIFTGNFPHDTHVIDNDMPEGGFDKFTAVGDDKSTFATSVSSAGYATGFIGKYLNDYAVTHSVGNFSKPLKGVYVPPGWTSWNAVGAGGYAGFNYSIANGSDVRFYGRAPQDYLTTVAQDRGVAFIRSQAARHKPFLLEVATFAPHKPFTPAPADVGTFAGLKAPHTPAFGRLPTHAPRWLANHAPLGAMAYWQINHGFERRVEEVQSVDRMIGALRATLAQTGQAGNTVFVFSSDNGYHMGEYTLRSGKQTAFDTDVVVPLVVAGPGIPAHTTNSDIVENIDLRPTFDQIAGAATPANVDGRSLVPLLHGEHPQWRTVAGIEHHRGPQRLTDPDRQNRYQGVPPSYNAIRTARFTYVRYADGDREFYDRATDRYELDNLGHFLSRARIAQLDGVLDQLVTCHGQQSCWRAGRP